MENPFSITSVNFPSDSKFFDTFNRQTVVLQFLR